MIKNHTISKNHLVSQAEGNIVSDMDGEKVMLSIHNGKYYNLGEMGGEIWERMKEPIIVQELITTLISQYDVEQNECEEQVTTFLGLLLEEGLMKANL
ncbi:lasso peptide biosynthesis PqqD family chaperone [Virgibacillus necropolis]|uniref:lasso peptide biosynthesis PqqD family chaperone n=1 Tax=Virgibacillus necropolis TaxID=163877 RepID=UPI00384FF29C